MSFINYHATLVLRDFERRVWIRHRATWIERSVSDIKVSGSSLYLGVHRERTFSRSFFLHSCISVMSKLYGLFPFSALGGWQYAKRSCTVNCIVCLASICSVQVDLFVYAMYMDACMFLSYMLVLGVELSFYGRNLEG